MSLNMSELCRLCRSVGRYVGDSEDKVSYLYNEDSHKHIHQPWEDILPEELNEWVTAGIVL